MSRDIENYTSSLGFSFFFFNDTATTEIYTLSLHDALPICRTSSALPDSRSWLPRTAAFGRSEEHTSELQSRVDLVCRLLLEKKKMSKRSRLSPEKRNKLSRPSPTTPSP